MAYEDYIEGIAKKDGETVLAKDKEYGGSWLKRGGVGAYMMLARKWDRIQNRVMRDDIEALYDIFDAIKKDERKESILDDIRDLRGYLILVEAEALDRELYGKPSKDRNRTD